MRLLALIVLLAAALPVHAQMYRCVDASGKRSFSDKPGPGCTADKKAGGTAPAPGAVPSTKAGTTPPATALKDPLPASVKAAAAARAAPAKDGKAAAAPKPQAETVAQKNGRCEALRQQKVWLAGPRSEGVQGRDAQRVQVEKALGDCS